MGRFMSAAVMLTLVVGSGCGGGGGGGDGTEDGPADWVIPFVPTLGSRSLEVGLRNLDGGATTVDVMAYRPDGMAYGPMFPITLDGHDEESLPLATALSGFAAAGGTIYVRTPSRRVEVWFDVDAPLDDAAEASRAFALPDLVAPPPGPFWTGVNVTTLTTSVQIINAGGVAAPITVTAFEESTVDPSAPPVAHAVVLAPFAAAESRLFSPDGLSGIPGFVGSFLVESATPVAAASEEDITFDVPRTAMASRSMAVALSFGRDPRTIVPTFVDFALVARNDGDTSRTISITRVSASDGSPIFAGSRAIALAAHESRAVPTTDAPFDDLFGDVLATAGIQHVSIELSVPAGVDVAFRQFEPQFLAANMSVTPSPTGHVLIASDVRPAASFASLVRTYATVINPTSSEITVVAEALIPQPAGFDATATVLDTLTIPAHGRVNLSPDGTTYANRDLLVVDRIGLRFRSNAPLCVTAFRERRTAANALETLVVVPVRALDDGE